MFYVNEKYISFIDFEGNYHEVNWFGKQCQYKKCEPKIVTINMKSVKTPIEFQSAIMQML